MRTGSWSPYGFEGTACLVKRLAQTELESQFLRQGREEKREKEG